MGKHPGLIGITQSKSTLSGIFPFLRGGWTRQYTLFPIDFAVAERNHLIESRDDILADYVYFIQGITNT